MSPALLEVAFDVVLRFKGHDRYQGATGALRALKRRAPDFAEEDRRAVFELFCRVYDRAVEAIGRHRVVPPAPQEGRFAEPADIDFDACLTELDEIEPGVALGQKGQILNWVIFWHYLK